VDEYQGVKIKMRLDVKIKMAATFKQPDTGNHKIQ